MQEPRVASRSLTKNARANNDTCSSDSENETENGLMIRQLGTGVCHQLAQTPGEVPTSLGTLISGLQQEGL